MVFDTRTEQARPRKINGRDIPEIPTIKVWQFKERWGVTNRDIADMLGVCEKTVQRAAKMEHKQPHAGIGSQLQSINLIWTYPELFEVLSSQCRPAGTILRVSIPARWRKIASA